MNTSRPLDPRTDRRRVVVLTAASFFGYATLMVLSLRLGTTQGPHESLRDLASLSFFLVCLCGWRLYFPRTLGLPSLLAEDLDERQRHVVTVARTRAYWVVSLLVVLGTIYLSLASGRGWPMPAGQETWQLIATTVSLLVGALPTALLAWTEPDPPAEEEIADALAAA